MLLHSTPPTPGQRPGHPPEGDLPVPPELDSPPESPLPESPDESGPLPRPQPIQ